MTGKRNNVPRIRSTAYHEAGHAVIAYHQRLKVYSATIRPDDDSSGRVRSQFPSLEGVHLDYDDIPPRIRDRMERNARMSLAGGIAQRQFNPRSLRHYHGHSDRHSAVNLISYLTGSNKELVAWINLLRVQTEGLVKKHWPEIEAVANALIEYETLTGRQIRTILVGVRM